MNRGFVLVCAVAIIAAPNQAEATNTFAREFGFACTQCHSVIPLLNQFGENFKANGYRIAGMRPARMVPLSSSMLAALETETGQTGPKISLEEWRLQSGGALDPSLTYYVEQYVIDDGAPGSMDQAWLQVDSNTAHPTAKIDLRARIGRLYLPLPVYSDTYRPTLTPYALFEQSVGANGFTLDGVHDGADFAAGDVYGSSSVHLFVSSHNDALFGTQRVGQVDFSVYRVVGSTDIGSVNDPFWRQGFAAVVHANSVEYRAVWQRGYDRDADGLGRAEWSSGGFVELQWFLMRNMIGALRFDGTDQEVSRQRSVTSALLFGLTNDSRLSLEDSFQSGKQSLRSSILVAF